PKRTHRESSPFTHHSQAPHDRLGFTATRVPGAGPDTPAPRPATSPAMSQPVQNGRGVLSAGIPPRTQRSRWFNPHARTRTSASRGPGGGVAPSSPRPLPGPPNSWKSAAFIDRASLSRGRQSPGTAARPGTKFPGTSTQPYPFQNQRGGMAGEP